MKASVCLSACLVLVLAVSAAVARPAQAVGVCSGPWKIGAVIAVFSSADRNQNNLLCYFMPAGSPPGLLAIDDR